MNKQNNIAEVIGWMDANFINFMYYEGRMLDEIVEDGPDNSPFTKEFKAKVRNFLYDIALLPRDELIEKWKAKLREIEGSK